MINEITFITGNSQKLADAQALFNPIGIHVLSEKITVPEIQSKNAKEISEFSAKHISETFNKPFFVMDRSFHIDSLKGFPGPFIKYINEWLMPEDILKLLEGHNNRKAYWTTSVSCFLPEKGITTFVGYNRGAISTHAESGKGYPIDEIFIPAGSVKVLAEFTETETTQFWNSSDCWKELVMYLKKA